MGVANQHTRRGNGAGSGAGWGGPAKGLPESKPMREPYEPGNTTAAGKHDMSRSARIEKLKDQLEHLAFHAESEQVQVTATRALLDRLEGLPIARNITVMADDISILDDAALDHRIAEFERELRPGAGGAEKTPDTDEP